ncbi:MAG: zinc ribbon domain-containing protein [Treponema sp.]|nr:zinc ribbon domain-containing protein [Treponema sp.]
MHNWAIFSIVKTGILYQYIQYMTGSQQAQKQEEKKTAAPPPSQTKVKPKDQNEILCPGCSAGVPEGALFCPECGFNLGQPSFCPNCGANVNPGADICITCKSWLLDGQCKFCYANLSHDAVFCPDCGNPKDGIPCPKCHNLSIFDFCTTCGIPLTEGGQAALELAQSDPDAKTMVESFQQAASIEAEIAKLESLISDAPETLTALPPIREKKERFSNLQMAAVLKSEQNIDIAAVRRAEDEKRAAESAKRKEEEKRQAAIAEAAEKKRALERQKAEALEAAQKAMMKFKDKQFLTHQEARRFHNAIKPAGDDVAGWLCNFTNTVHPDGPNGCDEPGHGGYWYKGSTIEVERKGPS